MSYRCRTQGCRGICAYLKSRPCPQMSSPDKCPVDHGSSAEACPVEPTSRSTWSRFFSNQPPTVPASNLSRDRETSTIPKASDGNWVYPSEAQFFAAMARKNHNPHAADMKTIVPIHNAVNERAWAEIMKWEAGRGGEACGGVKLVNFKGRPNDRSPRAMWKTLLGFVSSWLASRTMLTSPCRYSPPFDRHDWTVDRCGTQTRYIIDFYTGRNPDPSASNLAFHLDVRPAVDTWEGVKMRMGRFWGDLLGSSVSSSPSQPVKEPS